MSRIIVQLHVHTGCDAISGFFGHGKKSVMKLFSKSKDLYSLLKGKFSITSFSTLLFNFLLAPNECATYSTNLLSFHAYWFQHEAVYAIYFYIIYFYILGKL